MPKKDNEKPFIKFDHVGNNIYVPNFTDSALNEEVINSGSLKLLRDFFRENGSNLSRDDLDYLKARIASAEEIEKLKKKALKDLSEGKEHPVPKTDTKGGYTGFSDLKYPGRQTSANGCWSCAYSLMLKSRGVELSQEKIRAWRPDYQKTENGMSPAAANLWYMRNADTAMEIPYNVDMLADVLPNTAMSSLTMSPLELTYLTLIDPKTSKPVDMTAGAAEEIRKAHKKEAVKALRENIEHAINVDKSPVAVVVDGHYITVTGIDKNGKLRYEDSLYEVGYTTNYMTVDELYHIGFEVHDKYADPVTKVQVIPHGVSLNWLHDLKVPEYREGQISKPEYGENNDVITVDADGSVKIDVPANDVFRSNGANPADGQLHTQGVASMVLMDTKALEKKLGYKVASYGPMNGFTMANKDVYYPSRVCAKNDPRLASDMSVVGDKDIKTFGNMLLEQLNNSKEPYAEELRKQASRMLMLTNPKTSPKVRKKAQEALKTLPALLSQKIGGKTVLQKLVDEYIADKWEEKGKLIEGVNAINDKLDLGMDVASAMGKPAGTVYSGGDAKTEYELGYYQMFLDSERITTGKISRVAAEDALLSTIALMQLRKQKYEEMHEYPPKASEITIRKNELKSTAAYTEIKSMGVENFLSLGNSPAAIYETYKTISTAVYNKNITNIRVNENKAPSFKASAPKKTAAVKNINAIDDDFTLFGSETEIQKNKALRSKLNTIDSENMTLVPDVKGGSSSRQDNVIEGAAAPDNDLQALRRVLTAGKNAKVSKKAYSDILKALDEFEASYNTFKEVEANPRAVIMKKIEEENKTKAVNKDKADPRTPYDTETLRHAVIENAILEVQEKNRLLSETIDKYLTKSASLKGSDDYKLVLETAKINADDARIYMDDRAMQNDLTHISNVKQIDLSMIGRKVAAERKVLEERMLNAKSDRERVFLFNKSDAMSNVCDMALKNAPNELTDMEKQSISQSLGSLLFDKMCQKFPEMKNKVNTPKTQQQYEDAVMDITTTNSFRDLLNSMDREGLRHIVGESSGRDDLFKNFIKENYMTREEADMLSRKPAAVKTIKPSDPAKNIGK